MPAYIISEVRSVDEALMEQYRQLASESIAAHGGKYLVRGAAIEALEGEASDDFRLVVVEFPSRAAAQAWYQSPEYQAALQIRFRGALERRLVMVDGICPSLHLKCSHRPHRIYIAKAPQHQRLTACAWKSCAAQRRCDIDSAKRYSLTEQISSAGQGGDDMKKKAIAVAALAFAALMGTAGTASATDYLETDANGVPWHWATEADCQSDAPIVWNDPGFDRAFPYWYCGPGDGGWYLFSTDNR